MKHNRQAEHSHYLRLLVMIGLSFISMYVLMYSMVTTFGDVYNSVNQVYMAGLMTAPMVIIELLLMSSMYKNTKLNALVIGASCVIGIAFFLFIKQQAAVGDRQFLRSMIPHHSGAILMCQKASIEDQRIKDLCKTIISGQQAEIDKMRAMLHEAGGSR
jgi:uncharacterized protein (DUF305 family)